MKPTTPTDPGPAPPRAEFLRRVFRGVTVGLAPVLFVAFFLATVEQDLAVSGVLLALLQRLVMVGLAAAVVALAGLFGMRILRVSRCAPESLLGRFLLGTGLGLGVLSLATLALGSAGLAGPAASASLLAVFFLAGVRELRAVGNSLRRPDVPRTPPLSFFELLLVFVFLFVLVLQLILAFGLPLDYDACEYHVAAPARWFQLGRIDFVDGNAYANLPMNCEMLYLFGMGLCGRLMPGIHLAVVMNALVSVLAAGAVYVAARRRVSRRSALAAAALFFTMPAVMVNTTVNVYNEVLLAFYATLAVYAFLEFSETRAPRWTMLSAVFAGLAAGVKYTALVFFPECVAPAVILAATGVRFVRRIGTGLLYVLIVALVVSPWLVKNAAFTGNPAFPFLYRVFGGRDWSAELDEKWIAGQLQAADTAGAGNIFRATWQRVIAEPTGSFAIAGLAALALLSLRERAVRRLFAFLFLWTLFWYFGTHRVGRFWLPMAGVAAVLAARGFEIFRPVPDEEGKTNGAVKPWRRVAGWVLSAGLLAALVWQTTFDTVIFIHNAAGSYNLETGNHWYLGRRGRYDLFPLILFDQQALAVAHGEPYRLMLVGEARSLYLGPHTYASTVFNREVFTSTARDLRDPAAVRDRLRRAGVTHVFVNWFEVGRLRATYAWKDKDGVTHPGFPPLSPRDFKTLVDAGVLTTAGGFAPTLPTVRGLTPEEIADLPDGNLCVLYVVH